MRTNLSHKNIYVDLKMEYPYNLYLITNVFKSYFCKLYDLVIHFSDSLSHNTKETLQENSMKHKLIEKK